MIRALTPYPAFLTGEWRHRDILPGVLLSAAVAAIGLGGAWLIEGLLPVPAMVIALFAGIALHGHASRPLYRPGIEFCVRTVLRVGVALMGLRTGIADITALGEGTVGLVLGAMAITIASGFLFARIFGQDRPFGALVGVGTAVCGASAALAVATVLPEYHGKKADVIFVVVALNTLATIAMVAYPPLCMLLGFNEHMSGIMLGATIHDVAQVAGAGYPISEATGNTAIVVKLFRVFMLFPIVVAVGWGFSRRHVLEGAAKIPVPVFALVFVVLAIVNSILPQAPAFAPIYAAAKPALIQTANLALLLAIAALGLSTALNAIAALGWRHLATMLASTTVILVLICAGLAMQWT
jgi:uncharacterized integral membrane protein (TIGR00698 family)